MELSRRALLAGATGLAAGAVAGTAEAKPPPVRGPKKPPRTHVKSFSDGVGLRDYLITVGPPPIAGSQSAVSLTAADGEIISGSTQSNFQGNGFYTRNGFTRARDWTGPSPVGAAFTGFDDLNFIPISTWLTDFGGNGFYSRMDDLGINGMLPAAGSISLANNITFGKWAVVTSEHVGGSISSGDDPGVIGVSTGEEPGTVAQYDTIVSEAADWLATSDGPGRFHFFNFADNLLNGEVENVYFPDEMVTAGTFTACDQYWYAGAHPSAPVSLSKAHFRLYAFTAGDATQAQCARGSNYGSMMDSIRKNYPSVVGPIVCWIENGAPYEEAVGLAITPAQLKWAVWSTLVHGARAIGYFNHTFREEDPLISSNNFNNDGYGGPGIPGTGIYAAAKQVNWDALTIAPVINSPFDGYFVYGDTELSGLIATTGFLTAVTSTNTRSKYAGVDACCKWQPTQGKHYILSTTREPEASTNVPVTFRMVDQGQTTAVRLFDTTGSISIDRGGAIPGGFCEFSDTFATAAAYKAYRID